MDTVMKRISPDAEPVVDRRAPEPLLYSWDQLRRRAPIYLRRRSDKQRLAVHLGLAVGLMGLSVWWVVPRHSFAGPVILALSSSHGVHAGDLPTLVFGVIAMRSLLVARRLRLHRRLVRS
jgi:hypothetical protein